MTAPEADDLRSELRDLVAALREHVRWQGIVGAVGLPRDPAPLAGVSVQASETRRRPDADERSEPRAPAPRATEPAAPQPEALAARPVERGVTRAEAPRVEAPRVAGPALPVAETASPVAGATSRVAGPASPVAGSASQPSEGGPPRAEGRAPLPAGGRPADAPALVALAEEVRQCARCALHAGRQQTVFARGGGSSRLCFVGEGPGAEEDAQGEPFVGPAGQLLDKMIAAMGFDREEVYVCNVVKCRPPKNRTPHPDEMAACSSHLARQLEALDPEVIVALGATALQGLLGVTTGITRARGQWRLYRGRTPVMPTFHPAYLLRQPSAKREVWSDLKEVLRHLGRTLPERG